MMPETPHDQIDNVDNDANQTLTAVLGIRVGHAHDLEAATGCTVILCPPNTVGGIDQRGGAPGTRETDLLRPLHAVNHVNAIVLSGGSAFGLATADGVMRWLEERGEGFPTGGGVVPIVPAAILYDLEIGAVKGADNRISKRRPDAAMGYAACQAASDAPVPQGSVGAGAGATVGKLLGLAHATKGGIGSAAIHLHEGDAAGVIVAALIANNALGEVRTAQGAILAGVRTSPTSSSFIDVLALMQRGTASSPHEADATSGPVASNTVIGVIATNAKLDKEGACKVAQMAQDGIARAIRPAHTLWDGDTLFTLATGTHVPAPNTSLNISLIGALAAEVTEHACRQALLHATSLGGVPALRDLT